MPEERTSQKKKTRILPIELPVGEDRFLLGICLGIALIFWLLVKLSQTYRTEKTVVLYFSLPEGKAFSEMPPKDITATIQGTGWELLYEFLRSAQIGLSYDLREVQDRFVLSRSQLRSEILSRLSSGGMNIVELNYDDIVLSLEQKDTKRVPVSLHSRFSFEPGYQLQRPPVLSPDSVTLTGPASVIEKIDFWETDSIVLTELKSSLAQTTPLKPAPSGVFLSAQQVKVQVNVEQYSEKSFWIPVSVRQSADSVRVFPQTIRLTCVVGLSRYDTLSSADFEITADLGGRSLYADQRNTALLELTKRPDYVSHIHFSPKSIEFFLIK